MVFGIGASNQLSLLETALGAERLRKQVFANNLANADVPGFKRSDVSFEKQVLRALQTTHEAHNSPITAKVTDSRHIPFHVPMDWKAVQPKVDVMHQTTYLNNGSNVDPDVEAVTAAKTAERYMALSSFMDRHFRMMKTAIGR